MASGYNIGQIDSFSIFLGQGPLSLMYGVFYTHFRACKGVLMPRKNRSESRHLGVISKGK